MGQSPKQTFHFQDWAKPKPKRGCRRQPLSETKSRKEKAVGFHFVNRTKQV